MNSSMPSGRRPLLAGQVNFPLMLAPMVGLSHVGLRLLVRRYLPEGAQTIWPTEMLSSRRLPNQTLGETPLTYRHSSEEGLVPQILGNREKEISEAIACLAEWGISGVDINMGCPVNKALRHNYGVALMGDLDYAAEVVGMAVKHSPVPVSVKLRAGLQKDLVFLKDFVQALEGAGASWLCLHPRHAEQKRRGAADWSQIRYVREHVKVPVMGNGDIQVSGDVSAMFEQTGCDAVMIGRALTARPWLLWQMGEDWGWPAPKGLSGRAPRTPQEEAQEYGRALRFLLQVMQEYFDEKLGLKKFLFHVKVSHPWVEFGHHLCAKVSGAKTYRDLEQVIDVYFENTSRKMYQKTDLRY